MNARRICREIAADMERDVEEFNGKPFNGRTVGELQGNLAAAIGALAKIVETLMPEDDDAARSRPDDTTATGKEGE